MIGASKPAARNRRTSSPYQSSVPARPAEKRLQMDSGNSVRRRFANSVLAMWTLTAAITQ